MNTMRELNGTFTNTGGATTAGLPEFLCEMTARRNDGEASAASEASARLGVTHGMTVMSLASVRMAACTQWMCDEEVDGYH